MQPATRKPSGKELYNRLSEAFEAFESEPARYSAADGEGHRHIEADMDELGLDSLDDYWDLVYECIQLALENPSGCYAARGYIKSTRHKSIENLYMWPFEVEHENYDFPIYFKFCIQTDSNGANYVHIDCHPSRKRS